MHRFAAAGLIALLPLAASAQGAPGQVPPAQQRRGITRDQFVQCAAEMAGRRFDAIDTGHTGVVTRDQIRAFRQTHGGQANAPAE